ncbi:MAG: S8 family serine peptidase [Gemmatimonadota bacterium]
MSDSARTPARSSRHVMALAALTALAVPAACGDGDPSGPGTDGPVPPPAIEVDPSVEPAVTELPGFEDGAPRPVASVVDEEGNQADFVENELWLTGVDASALEAFLARWDGEALDSIDPSDLDLDGRPKHYLVRVNAGSAAADSLVADLRALDPDSYGAHRVSSEAGLALLAAGADEAAAGLDVGVNWVGRGFRHFRDGTTSEAPDGPVGYVPNAFEWTSHRQGGPQDIGVAAAWRALDYAGKLDNRVGLAILDMGFEDDADWRSGWTAIGNVPGVNPIGTSNLLDCGSPCPWHGTQVFSAAMALPDNGYGAAGPAGPVANPTVVFTSYDFFSSISALWAAGTSIVNMSYGARVPTALAWSVYPFDAATNLYRDSGGLIFAAAGNDGANVDAEKCFGIGRFKVCVEKAWHTPCENAGVICVGGLRRASKARAGQSNYGEEHVDIFAPFTVWVGPDPDNPQNRAQSKSGTSFASPFAAGVAALIWAADPSMSADEVADLLFETAHESGYDDVGRYVNAFGAVNAVLGNIPPSLEITSPEDGAERQVNLEVAFDALVSDFEDGQNCCTPEWSSSVDGDLGTGLSIYPTFSTLGFRTITASAQDEDGAVTTAEVTIEIVNTPPSPEITRPTPGEEVFRSEPYTLRGTADDPNEPDGTLDCSGLAWTSSGSDAAFPATGCEPEVEFDANGARALVLTATDSHGESAADTVEITVVDPPEDLPPSVQVLSPENGIAVGPDTELSLEGEASDPEGETDLDYEWAVVYPYDEETGTGENTEVIGTGTQMTWRPSDTIEFDCDSSMDVRIELRATDPGGNTGIDFVVIRVSRIC